MNVRSAIVPAAQTRALAILGIRVAAVAWNDAVRLLEGLLEERRFTRIGFLNAHNANIACADRAFASALKEFLLLPDGVGVDMAAKILHGQKFPANLNGTDFIPGFLAQTQRPLTVGLIGAKKDNAEEARNRFATLAPQHRFVLVSDGYFDVNTEPHILTDIGRLRPDILLVAMGVPRQELWIARNLTAAHCTLPIAVGALFDFMSGAVPRAPEQVRRMRLEWLFRLAIEPARLWRRYMLGNPIFLARVLRERFSR